MIARGGITMANADLEIFWLSGSPYAWRGLLALEVKQLKYTSRLLDASKGEVKAPEYLKLNPRGTVPTLKDGEVIVRESLAIRRSARRYSAAGPVDRRRRGRYQPATSNTRR